MLIQTFNSGSSSSTTGGKTKTGSGTTPAYGGGKYYGGGASVPYSSGGKSPSGITPIAIGASAGLVAGTALYAWSPHYWPYGAYNYPYSHTYTFHNDTANKNETKPVECLCAQYEECSCDDNTNSTYMNDIIGNGSYAAMNHSLATVADVNGASTILINGTLANGTTASGGTEDAFSRGSLSQVAMQSSSYVVMAAVVGCAVFFV